MGPIHDPLLQHRANRLGNLSTKVQRIELSKIGRILVDNLQKMQFVASMIAEQSNLRLEPIGAVREKFSTKVGEFERIAENSISFKNHSWHDVQAIFEKKASLLMSSIRQITDLIKFNTDLHDILKFLDDAFDWLRRLQSRVRSTSIGTKK